METFCIHQERAIEYNYQNKPEEFIRCSIAKDLRACPYTKPAKAIKKCQDYREQKGSKTK